MDFKNLMQLAKDKQSYLQQKHQREKQAKEKQENEKAKYQDKQAKALLEQKAIELQRRKEARLLEAQKKLIEKQRQQRLLEAKNSCIASNSTTKSNVKNDKQISKNSNGKQIGDKQIQSKQIHNTNSSNTKRNGIMKQSNGQERSTHITSSKSHIKNTSAKNKTAMSFADLMKIAQDQKNKPVVPNKKETKPVSQTKPELEANPTLKRRQQESIETDINRKKMKGAKEDKYASEIKRSNHIANTNTTNGRKVVTKTLVNGPSLLSNQKAPLQSDSRHLMGKKAPPSNRNRQLKALDDELEQKRRDIERRKKQLENKYRHGYQDDDDDDDYDSYDDVDLDGDLDEFIDDSDSNVNVSKYIQQIFGYKRSRYNDEDDDLRDMESNYRQIQQEEARSTRIGRMEDELERIKEQKMLAAEQNKKKRK